MSRARPPRARFILLAASLLLGSSALMADVLVLVDGDRVTGKIVAQGTKRIRIQTPYGLLIVPREKIERIRKDDGTEEVLNGPPATPPPLPPPPPPLRLVVVITGGVFWQAWDPKAAPADPSLRLEVRLDEKPVAAYVDATLDPDIPGAIVNSFSFAPETLAVVASPKIRLGPPETRPGRILLEIDLPPQTPPPRHLRLAYQANEGTTAEPAWRDLAEASLEVDLKAEAPTFVKVEQDRGKMEFSKRRMRNVDTFRMVAKAE
jgi:hypothetical protein